MPDSCSDIDLDQLVDRFERAWQQRPPPAIEEFLPEDPAAANELLLELVKVDLEYRWSRCGVRPARPRLEDYVGRLPALGPLRRLPAELIAEEYRVRHRWGDRPGHAEYAARF